MRQALFFDIDGTILSEITKEIPQSTFRALSKAKENGHLLFINTGRTRCTLPIKITEMPFDGFLCGLAFFLHIEMKFFIKRIYRQHGQTRLQKWRESAGSMVCLKVLKMFIFQNLHQDLKI